MFLVLIFTRGCVDTRVTVRSEGDMSLKNPMTTLGIDTGTVRLVLQRLNHYATPGPLNILYIESIVNVFKHLFVNDNLVLTLVLWDLKSKRDVTLHVQWHVSNSS
jgi:hypothetical protein